MSALYGVNRAFQTEVTKLLRDDVNASAIVALPTFSPNFLVKRMKIRGEDQTAECREGNNHRLDCMQQTLTQQFKSCTTIHHALRRLELVDKSLGLSLIPGEAKGGLHGIIIALDIPDKTFEFGYESSLPYGASTSAMKQPPSKLPSSLTPPERHRDIVF